MTPDFQADIDVTQHQEIVRKYLSATADTYWQWDEAGEAISWAWGETLVFRAELLEILEQMNQDGHYEQVHSLPSLNVLLLIISASRQQFDVDAVIEVLKQYTARGLLQEANLKTQLTALHENMMEVGAEVPRSEVIAHLVELLNLKGHHLAERCATPQILKVLCLGPQFPLNQAAHVPDLSKAETESGNDLHQDLAYFQSVMKLFLQKYSDRDLETEVVTKRDTGVAEMPDAIEIPEDTDKKQVAAASERKPSWHHARELITALSKDDAYSGLVSVAQDLIGIISMPQKLGEKSDIPFGGFSDISNRGTLDKLMLTELAYDDLSLAMRVVNGEAMYLRRETYPKQYQTQRHLLPDLGLLMWGLPRMISGSLFAALSGDRHLNQPLKSWVPSDDSSVALDEVIFSQREDLVRFMSRMDTQLDSLHLLEHLLVQIGELESEDIERKRKYQDGADVLPVRHELVMINHQMQMEDAIYLHQLRNILWQTNGQSGTVRFESVLMVTYEPPDTLRLALLSPSGIKPVNTIHIATDKYQQKLSRPVKVDDETHAPIQFLSMNPKPLRYPCKHIHAEVRLRDDTVFCFTKDRRLMRWENNGRQSMGPVELTDHLPELPLYQSFACAASDLDLTDIKSVNRLAVVAVFGRDLMWKVRIYLEDGELVQSIDLDMPADWIEPRKLKGFVITEGKLVMIFARKLETFSLQDGKSLQQSAVLPSKYQSHQHRFIRAANQSWYRISFASGSLSLKKMDYEQAHTCYFHACGIGDLFIPDPMKKQVVYRMDNGQPLSFEHRGQAYIKEVSRDGWRLRLQSTTESYQEWMLKISGHDKVTVQRVGYRETIESHPWLHQRSVRAKLESVTWANSALTVAFADHDELNQPHLVLITKKAFLHLIIREKRLFFVSEVRSGKHGLNASAFLPMKSGGQMKGRALLSEAKWHGLRFILDNRGLLHIQHHANEDCDVTEMSLVLEQNQLSGWCNNGAMFGESYYTGLSKHQLMQSEVIDFVKHVVSYMLVTEDRLSNDSDIQMTGGES